MLHLYQGYVDKGIISQTHLKDPKERTWPPAWAPFGGFHFLDPFGGMIAEEAMLEF